MSNVLRKRAVHFLNGMEVIESQGGEEAYAIVENNEENRYLLMEAGIPLEIALKYGDEETFCILALAFGEGYADLHNGEKLIAYDGSVEIEVETGKSLVLYKNEDDYFISLHENNGYVSIVKLAEEQLQVMKSFIA